MRSMKRSYGFSHASEEGYIYNFGVGVFLGIPANKRYPLEVVYLTFKVGIQP